MSCEISPANRPTPRRWRPCGGDFGRGKTRPMTPGPSCTGTKNSHRRTSRAQLVVSYVNSRHRENPGLQAKPLGVLHLNPAACGPCHRTSAKAAWIAKPSFPAAAIHELHIEV